MLIRLTIEWWITLISFDAALYLLAVRLIINYILLSWLFHHEWRRVLTVMGFLFDQAHHLVIVNWIDASCLFILSSTKITAILFIQFSRNRTDSSRKSEFFFTLAFAFDVWIPLDMIWLFDCWQEILLAGNC